MVCAEAYAEGLADMPARVTLYNQMWYAVPCFSEGRLQSDVLPGTITEIGSPVTESAKMLMTVKQPMEKNTELTINNQGDNSDLTLLLFWIAILGSTVILQLKIAVGQNLLHLRKMYKFLHSCINIFLFRYI